MEAVRRNMEMDSEAYGEALLSDRPPLLSECRVCGAGEIVRLCSTYNEHSKSAVLEAFRCEECGSVFVGNVVDSTELGAAYATLNSKTYFEEIERENRKKMITAIDHLRLLIDQRDAIIDIGAGDGLFVRMLHQARFVDLSAHEIKGADLSGIAGIAQHIYQDFDYRSIPSESFDCVTLLDVLEHVVSPKTLLEMCARVLKGGGVLYVHTPVVTRIDRVMHHLLRVPLLGRIGAIWQRGRTSIFHLQNFTPKALRGILESVGFRDIRIEVRNELSWPVTRYVRTYLLEKHGLPGYLAPLIAPIFCPLLATKLLNANKAIISARK